MQLELATVHGREKIFSQQRKERKRGHAERQKTGREDATMADTAFQHPAITGANALKLLFKCVLEMYKRVAASLRTELLFAGLQQIQSERRDECPGEQIGGEH